MEQSNNNNESNQQNEITSEIDLLNDKGQLQNPGWARKPHFRYNKEKIKASWSRLKEWDFYAVVTPKFAFQVTFADLGFGSFFAACFLDFESKQVLQEDDLQFFAHLALPSHPDQETPITVKSSKLTASVEKKGNERLIKVSWPKWKGKGLEAEITLFQEDWDTMVIATPWGKDHPQAFYYNQKVNNLIVSNCLIKIGKDEHLVKSTTEEPTYAVLDWGRGVWTYQNRWYWASASGTVEGQLFGMNLGYGFGDTSKATENIFFVNGKGHKLKEVTFHISKEGYLSHWRITSNDNRINLNFTPIVERPTHVNYLILKSEQHQVFGSFDGTVVLDDGSTLNVKNLLGFAEDCFQRW